MAVTYLGCEKIHTWRYPCGCPAPPITSSRSRHMGTMTIIVHRISIIINKIVPSDVSLCYVGMIIIQPCIENRNIDPGSIDAEFPYPSRVYMFYFPGSSIYLYSCLRILQDVELLIWYDRSNILLSAELFNKLWRCFHCYCIYDPELFYSICSAFLFSFFQ